MQKLSSTMTFFWKFIFPTSWIAGFTISTISTLITSFFKEEAIPFAIVTVLGSLFLYLFCTRLKVVKMKDNTLYISNYIKEIEIDKSNIEDITENVLINLHPVYIHFKNETEFGYSIMFIPKFDPFLLFASHRVVNQLKNFADIK